MVYSWFQSNIVFLQQALTMTVKHTDAPSHIADETLKVFEKIQSRTLLIQTLIVQNLGKSEQNLG